jgi:trimethylamine:corrinoid methyltransferase-like protein
LSITIRTGKQKSHKSHPKEKIMNLMGLQGGQYKPLSEQQVDTVHNAALTILEKTGITYESGLENTVDMLEKNGAAVNREKKRQPKTIRR